jgi:hypothetical protein
MPDPEKEGASLTSTSYRDLSTDDSLSDVAFAVGMASASHLPHSIDYPLIIGK